MSAEDETRIGSLMNFLAPVTSLQHLTVTDGSDFISIYNPQQHLKSLFCKEANSSLISFISPETLKSLKLEELSDLPYQLIGSPQENYKLFLESQKTSLKFLRISTSLGLWPSILRLENLKSLETALIRKIPAPVRINSSVQSLKLHLKDCKYFPIKLKKFLRQFVNLRDLKLILEMEGSGFGWNPLKLSTRLVHLESVTIILHYDNDLFKKLKIDKLKVFIVTNVTCVPSIWKGLFERCPNIRVLEIENSFMNIDILFLICTKLKHLEELTLTPRSPLDYFQPFDMTCDHQSLKIILKNCAKLKSLKIVLTGTYTSYRPLLRRFKKKLQNIKCDLEYTNIDFMATGEEDEFDVSDESYDSDDNEPSSKVARIS